MNARDEFLHSGIDFGPTLKQLCTPVFDHFGVVHAFIVSVSKNGAGSLASTTPELTEYFIDKNYIRIDPHIVCYDNMSTGFAYSSEYDQFDYEAAVLNDIERRFGICHTFNIVRKYEDYYRVFGFSTTRENKAIYNNLLSEYALINAFIDSLEIQLDAGFKEYKECSIDIVSLKGDFFYKQKGIHNPDIDKRMRFLSKIGAADPAMLAIPLSPREMKCAKYYFKGFTSKQIAKILSISSRTVESYIASAKKKFGTTNKERLYRQFAVLENAGLL